MNPRARIDRIEAALSRDCAALAAALALPHGPERAEAIAARWRSIAAQEMPYRLALGAVHSATALAPSRRSAEDAVLRRDGPLRLASWPAIAALLDRQLTPFDAPLLTTQHRQVAGPADGAVDNMMRALHLLANPDATHTARLPDSSYGDVPLSGAHFLDLMGAARRIALAVDMPLPLRFLDVGCGGGTKVLAAASYCEEVTGLELDPTCADHARGWLRQVGVDCTIRTGDALDFTDYHFFDVIYFFRPLRDPDLQAQLERRIAAQARPGTIIVAAVSRDTARIGAPMLAQVSGPIFMAHTDADTAAAIAQKARRIGPDPALWSAAEDARLGFWVPVLAASRRCGFALDA